jgi:hypothetical protein
MKKNIVLDKKMNRPKFQLQEDAIKFGIENGHNFFFSKDTQSGGKVTSSLKDLDTFLLWFDNQPLKHFYEKIIDERVEYYDIDGELEKHQYWKNSKTQILDDFFDARDRWIETTDYNNKYLDITTQAYILDACTEKKKSFHIIIRNGYVFKNCITQKKFINNFKKFLDNENNGLTIDTAPYGNRQCFRTINSSKINKNNTLKRSDYNELSQTCDIKNFFVTWIQPELDEASDITCLFNDTQDNINFNM